MIQSQRDVTHDGSGGDRGTTAPDGRPLAEQPKWRQDFPIEVAEDEYVSRRELVKFVVLTSAALATGQFWIALQSAFGGDAAAMPRMAIAGVDELSVGGGKSFTYPEGSTPRLLVRTGTDSFVAYDQQCTHLLCPVVPVFEQRRLHCPCHNGWFDLQTGQALEGPPRRPLPRISLEVRDGTVFATGVETAAT